MRQILILTTLLIATGVYSQSYEGPALGSYASGVYVTTNSFTNQPVSKAPKFETVRNKIKIKGFAYSIEHNEKLPGELEIYNEGGASTEAGGVALIKSFEGNTESSSIPPDPHVAVGPDHVVGTVNSDFAIWDKNGNLLKRIDAGNWYSSFGVDPFDPKVVYDHFAQRWVMVWLDQRDSPQRGYIMISVSDDSNPLGTWRNWLMPSNMNGTTTTTNWGDYQGVGFDEDNFLITSNQFNFGGWFDYAKIRVIKKSELYNNPTDTCKWYDFWNIKYPGNNQSVFNIRPVIHFTPSDTTYFVHIPYYSSNAYVLYRVTYDGAGIPSLSGNAIPVTTYSDPPQASQPGGVALESSGPELTNEPVYRDGSIWLTHSTRNPLSGSFSAVRMARLNPFTSTPIEQLTFGTPSTWYFYPAIMIDKGGNMVFTVSRSSPTEYVSAYYVGKQSGSTTFTQPYLLMPGKGQYQKDYGSGRNRWGDYLGISLDPTGETFWMMSEYVAAPSVWSNRIGEVRMMPVTGASLLTDIPKIDFLAMERGKEKDTITLQMINVGSQQLIINSLGLSNSAFSLAGQLSYPLTINSFDSLAISVVCNPQTAGMLYDTLVLVDNDPVENRIPIRVESFDLNPVAPQKVLVVTNSTNGGGTFVVNKSTGESTLLGSAGATSFSSISANPKTGVIYGFRASGGQTLLNKMDANTGKLYSRTTLDLADVTGSAFDTSGTLYLVAKRSVLYKYNEMDNTLIRTDSVKCTVSAIAFDPLNNQIFGSIYKPLGADKDKILRIIQGSGDTIRIGNLGNNKPVRSLFFDEAANLFGFTGVASASGEFTAINKSNGLGTVIGSTGLIGLVSAAYYPGVINSIGETGDGSVLTAYKLFDNYPNPFNPSTVIRFSMPVSGMVTLQVYNTLGEKVAVLINGNVNAGEHKVEFDASGLTSGVYFCELRTGDFRSMKKMVLLR